MKKIFKKYFFLVLLVISIINIYIPMPISDNGTLQIAIIELFLPIAILIFLLLIFRKKVKLEKGYKKIFKFIIIFIIFYILISIIRILMGYEFKQSLLAIKVTIFPMILIFMARYLKIDKEYIIKNLITFEFIINCLQLTNYSNFRMSFFLGNIMVYLSIIAMLFIVNIYVLKESKYSITLKIFSIFNILMTLIIPLMAGARSTFLITSFVSLIMTIYYLLNKNIKFALLILAMTTFGFAINIYLFNNYRDNIGMYQNRVLPTIFKIENNVTENPSDNVVLPNFNITPNIPSDNNIPEINEKPADTDTNTEKIKSDNIRKYLVDRSIKSIKKAPLIGEGIMYFDVNTDYGVSLQSAHNFILEYINAYGIIGFVVYLLIHFAIISSVTKNKNLYVIMVLTIFTILTQSLVQPTMLIVPIVIIYYTLYALFLGWSEFYE